MLPYAFTFVIACYMFNIAENERLKTRTFLATALVAGGIVVLCALAGARDYGIGTDTTGYGIWLFNLARDTPDFQEFIYLAMNDKIHMDFLFAAQAFAVIRLTDSIFWYYFAIEAAMLVPIYISLRVFAHPTMVAPCMLFYLVLFYIPGYNAMRQYIAMSFMLLAFARLYRGRYVASLIWYVCSLLYHTSAIIGLVPLLAWPIFVKRLPNGDHEPRLLSRIIALPCLVIMSLLLANSLNLIDWLTSSIPIFAKYHYTLSYQAASHLSGYILFGFLLCMLTLLAYRKGELKSTVVIFLICMIALYFPLQTLEVYSQALQRMGRYMLLFAVPLLALVTGKREPLSRLQVSEVAIYCCSVAAFVWLYAISGTNEAIPYTSMFFQ